MTTPTSSPAPRKRLPVSPSQEHLRKQAKRLARQQTQALTEAQHQLAREYGCKNWAELMHTVEVMNRGADQLESVKRIVEPLPKAVRARDVEAVHRILASGLFTPNDLDAGLAHAAWYGGDAPEVLAVRKELFDLLLAQGADPDGQYGSAYGPIIFGTGECLSVEGLQWLLEAGADVTFEPVDTKYGRQCALSYWLGTYGRGSNAAKHRGIELLLAAGAYLPPEVSPEILAVHRGDEVALSALIDAEPQLAKKQFADMPYGNVPLKGGTLLHCAVEFGELSCVKFLMWRGAPIDARTAEGNTALWIACRSEVPDADRMEIAKLLLKAGANPRLECAEKTTPLHQAAKRGPLELVELLIRNGAREWQTDNRGRKPVIYAREGDADERERITELLDRPVIFDDAFKYAVKLIHEGDTVRLRELLREQPYLIHERAMEPECYPPGYFGNPKLFWFIANNPNLIRTMPANMVEVAEVLILAGVDREDLNYALELVMTSTPTKEQGLRSPLMKLLLAHGATVTPQAIQMALGHEERDAVAALLATGIPMTAAIAAGMGLLTELPGLLVKADAEEMHTALSLAVINRQLQAARMCLDAEADVNRFLRVHVHSMPAHQAAINDDVAMLKLLLQHGARLDVRDTLWGGTPLGWAMHEGKRAAEAYLRGVGAT